jgi:hypothetical protein
MSKHTPGPWRTTGIDGMGHEWVTSGGPIPIAHCFPQYTTEEGRKELRSNARLIAASPSLLASLTELAEWMRAHTGPSDGTHEMLCRAVEVIKAAGGEV